MITSQKRLRALTVAVALFAAACGGGSTDTSTASPGVSPLGDPAPASPAPAEPGADPAPAEPGEPGEATEPAQSDLPDVTVVDVATDQSVNLRSLAPADKPILLWFYAPH